MNSHNICCHKASRALVPKSRTCNSNPSPCTEPSVRFLPAPLRHLPPLFLRLINLMVPDLELRHPVSHPICTSPTRVLGLACFSHLSPSFCTSTSTVPMARDVFSRSTWRRKYCPSPNTKGPLATTPMRTMTLLGDRMGDPLHINRETIEISQAFMGVSRPRSGPEFWQELGNVWDMLITPNFLGKNC